MNLEHVVSGMLSVGLMVLGSSLVAGQNYPTKPIRILVAGAGGASDLVARAIAQGISGNLGQQVIVVNYPSGDTPGLTVGQAPTDGYTLLAAGSTFLIAQLFEKNPFDWARELLPITLTNRSPYVLSVHPALPTRSVKELIALAKARPGALNYASPGTGSAGHLAAELFKAMAGVDIVRIPYNGGGAMVIALTGGEVPMGFLNAATATPHVKAGRLRALAVTSAQPSALAPGLPTVAASGLPGFETITIYGVFAPAKTPIPIINRLYEEIVRFLNRADVKEQFLSLGVEAVGSTPEEFVATIKSEITKWSKVIKQANIRVE